MSKSVWRRASQSRPLLGKSVDLIQSPCSRQRMRILVSARLQAIAAPEAPEPMIRTSTRSLPAISALPRGGAAVVPPEGRAVAHGVEQGPVSLLEGVALREGRAGLHPEGQHDTIIAVIGGQDHPPEGRARCSAAGAIVVDQGFPSVAGHAGEGTNRLCGDRRQGLADQRKIAAQGPRDISQDGGIVGAGHAEGGAFGDHRPGDVAEVLKFRGGESGFGGVIHDGANASTGTRSYDLLRRMTGGGKREGKEKPPPCGEGPR